MRLITIAACFGPMISPAAMADVRPNVLGQPLQACCHKPKTGYARDGMCRAIDSDHGTHTVCAIVSKEFLEFTRGQGNDLITARPEHDFPGLKPGDRWCLCALRFREALAAGKAPEVILEATDKRTLDFVSMDDLRAHQSKMPNDASP